MVPEYPCKLHFIQLILRFELYLKITLSNAYSDRIFIMTKKHILTRPLLEGFFMESMPHYLLVESHVLPEVFLKVVEAKRLLLSGQVHSVNEAARAAGISRSAFYKYKDSVHPFNEDAGGYIITLHAMLRDEAGMLSKLTGLLYHEGANIMTINQNIPVGGFAPVTVTARADGMKISLSDLLDRIREIDGVNSIEVVSGF